MKLQFRDIVNSAMAFLTGDSFGPNVNAKLAAGTNAIGKVQLDGRLVIERPIVTAAAITDTVNHDYTVDVSDLIGDKALLIKNTCNQTATITVYAETADGALITYGGGTVTGTVNASSNIVWGRTNNANLTANVSRYRFRVVYATAPTSGSITAVVTGVKG